MRFATWHSIAPADMDKGLNAGLHDYDGTVQGFADFASSLEFYLGSIDFVLHFASSHWGRLSGPARHAVSAAQRDFLEIYGPHGLKTAHNDCLKILIYIFGKFPATANLVHMSAIHDANRATSKHGASLIWDAILSHMTPTESFVCRFTLKLVETAGSFNGVNWHDLTNDLKSDLQRAPDTIKLRDLAALRLLDAIRKYGQINPDYADLHRKIIDMKESAWIKVRGVPDKYQTILALGTALQTRIEQGESSFIVDPPVARAYADSMAGVMSPGAGQWRNPPTPESHSHFWVPRLPSPL